MLQPGLPVLVLVQRGLLRLVWLLLAVQRQRRAVRPAEQLLQAGLPPRQRGGVPLLAPLVQTALQLAAWTPSRPVRLPRPAAWLQSGRQVAWPQSRELAAGAAQ